MGKRTYHLLLIDGHSQMYRAIFAPGPKLTSPDGEPTHGTYYFTRMLLRLLREKRPQYCAVAVDGPRDRLERRRLYPAYKTNRHAEPDPSIPVQIKRMLQIVKALGLPVISSPGWEADDVIATLARRFRDYEMRTEVVTRDKDLHQLVSDRYGVSLYDPQTDESVYDAQVEEHWGCRPERVVDAQTLIGDPTDCVPGVKGIGPKNARALLTEFGSIERALASPHLSQRIRTAILEADLDLCRTLVRLNANCPLEPDPQLVDLRYRGPRLSSARPIFKGLGFTRLAGVDRAAVD